MVISGTPPGIGKLLFLGLENGRPEEGSAALDLGVAPVTVLADGCDPPIISCMKKDSVGVGDCGADRWRVVAESAEDRAVRKRKRESGSLAINLGFRGNDMRENGYIYEV